MDYLYVFSQGEEMSTGIYRIHNTETGISYIGSTTRDLELRIKEHKRMLRGNYHDNTRLQYSYNVHGKQCFDFVVVEECAVELVYERELFWITYYLEADGDIFNFQLDPIRNIVKEETKQKISNTLKGRKPSTQAIERKIASQIEYYSDPENRRKLSKATSKKVYPNIVSPDGVVYSTEWLPEFCKIHNLEYSGVRKLLTGGMESGHYKGWYVEGNKPDAIILRGEKQSDDWVAKRTRKGKSKPFKVLSPDGIVYVVDYPAEFCRQHNLNVGNLLTMVKYGKPKSCSGWIPVVEDEV